MNHRLADLLGVEVPQSVPKGTLQALIERPFTVMAEEPAPTVVTEELTAPGEATNEPATTTEAVDPA